MSANKTIARADADVSLVAGSPATPAFGGERSEQSTDTIAKALRKVYVDGAAAMDPEPGAAEAESESDADVESDLDVDTDGAGAGAGLAFSATAVTEAVMGLLMVCAVLLKFPDPLDSVVWSCCANANGVGVLGFVAAASDAISNSIFTPAARRPV